MNQPSRSSPPDSEKKDTFGIESLAASHQWTQLNSNESSYPDISFPSRPRSPQVQHRNKDDKDPHPPSATLTIFDSTLSVRTRVLALTSSLAINFFLPFINGVMLGFGEIFAKGVVGYFGWNTLVPGGTASAVGIGAVGARRRAKME